MLEYSKNDPPEVRFWAKVVKSSSPDGCWHWIGGKTGGYGIITIQYKSIGAHRFSYELHNGSIPNGLFVCHHCDTPSCVNPAHLFLGTPKDNMDDMVQKGRQRRTKPPVFSGEDHPCATLTWEQVEKIRSLYASGRNTITELATIYGTRASNIGMIVHWRSWRTPESPPPEFPGKGHLTEENVQEIRAEYRTGNILQRELADRFGVSCPTISMIVNHKRHSR